MTSAPAASNLFEAIPAALPEEIAQTLLQSGSLRIERIVSKGHCSEDGFWYDQAQAEWVLLVQGSAKLQFENRTLSLEPGDHVNIPAHVKHRVAWTTPAVETIWLAIFY